MGTGKDRRFHLTGRTEASPEGRADHRVPVIGVDFSKEDISVLLVMLRDDQGIHEIIIWEEFLNGKGNT